jgi:hypothetical protein
MTTRQSLIESIAFNVAAAAFENHASTYGTMDGITMGQFGFAIEGSIPDHVHAAGFDKYSDETEAMIKAVAELAIEQNRIYLAD